jgi:transposase-like protein
MILDRLRIRCNEAFHGPKLRRSGERRVNDFRAGTMNKLYSIEVKQEAVRLLRSGLSQLEVARKVGAPTSSVRRWYDRAASGGLRALVGRPNKKEVSSTTKRELRQLQTAHKRWIQEGKVIHKAMVRAVKKAVSEGASPRGVAPLLDMHHQYVRRLLVGDTKNLLTRDR